ncbi:MAG TPA: 50S ribosomal protein L23 [Candidatus Saccharimonadales bacterium]|nr:50S ribosomal protein L23 [Candidatus Saccharimonadales bacterium]
MSKTMTLQPAISEKAYGLSKSGNVYVFKVPAGSNKLTVKKAVEDQFSVSVNKVNISHSPGKPKRTVRKGGRRVVKGFQKGYKKAYVGVKQGDIIPIFASEEDEKAKGKTAKAKREAK